MVDSCYIFPWTIFQKYFPNGTEEEFDKAFVSFDVSEKEFNELTNGNPRYICLESVIFDKSLIKTSINSELKIENTFRDTKEKRLNEFGYHLDLDDTTKAYELGGIKKLG